MAYLRPIIKQPSVKALERQYMSEGLVPATDGCKVEVDGKCPHGHVSWVWYLGF